MRKIIYLLLLFTVAQFTQNVCAQVTIGSSDVPDENAILDLVATDKGLLLPRLELISNSSSYPLENHVAGMVVFNSGTVLPQGFYFNDGSQWVYVADKNATSWRNANTNEPATSGNDDVYQMGSVGIGTESINPNAQLDIFSTTKGVLLPRMSTDQRNSIPVENADGMLIFNISTHCFNYYDGAVGEWLSLCGETNGPAIFSFTDYVGGSSAALQAGTALTNSNTYTINVTVSEPGTYKIVLITGNGYSFSKSGIFYEAGTNQVVLEGQGTPVIATSGAGDLPTAYFNGQQVTLPDGQSLPGVTVNSSSAVFEYLNTPVTPQGDYALNFPVGETHYVELPINVTVAGKVVIKTNEISGIYFEGTVDMQTLGLGFARLYAKGIPEVEGIISGYHPLESAFPTFSITVRATLGSFAHPAKSCLAIYNELKLDDVSNKSDYDGEYWIRESATSNVPVRTFCDMTSGGYTLLWSYSEKTLRNTYAPTGTMVMSSSNAYLSANYPQNVRKDATDIVYENHRLSLATMRNAKTTVSQGVTYRVRIVYRPKDMADKWGAQNHFLINPKSDTYDYLLSTATSSSTADPKYLSISGRVFNLRWIQNADKSAQLYGVTTQFPQNYATSRTGVKAYYGKNTNGGNYFGFDYALDSRLFVVGDTSNEENVLVAFTSDIDGNNILVPAPPYGSLPFPFAPAAISSLFGAPVDESSSNIDRGNINHHIGKCFSNGHDYYMVDKASTICLAKDKYPHSFNNGEGRYIQWWVK